MKSEKVMKKWAEKYDVELKKDSRADRQLFWSDVYGRFIPIGDVKGFCPICEEPLLALDVGDGRCGRCGALFNGRYAEGIKKTIDLKEKGAVS